jgi:hypothetical protein
MTLSPGYRSKNNNGSPLLFPGERGGYLDLHHFRPTSGAPPRSRRRGEDDANRIGKLSRFMTADVQDACDVVRASRPSML